MRDNEKSENVKLHWGSGGAEWLFIVSEQQWSLIQSDFHIKASHWDSDSLPLSSQNSFTTKPVRFPLFQLLCLLCFCLSLVSCLFVFVLSFDFLSVSFLSFVHSEEWSMWIDLETWGAFLSVTKFEHLVSICSVSQSYATSFSDKPVKQNTSLYSQQLPSVIQHRVLVM